MTASMFHGGDPARLTTDERETVDAVLDFYGPKSGQWLSDLTHAENPWRDARARAGVSAGQYFRETITLAEMAEYYSGLTNYDSSAHGPSRPPEAPITRQPG